MHEESVRVQIGRSGNIVHLPPACLNEVLVFKQQLVGKFGISKQPNGVWLLHKDTSMAALDCMIAWYRDPPRDMRAVYDELAAYEDSVETVPDFVFRMPHYGMEIRSQQPIVQLLCHVWDTLNELGAIELAELLFEWLKLFSRENYYVKEGDVCKSDDRPHEELSDAEKFERYALGVKLRSNIPA
jgi:hypothetical protein